jgi:ABC-type lipoprotein release transport system permease subunit
MEALDRMEGAASGEARTAEVERIRAMMGPQVVTVTGIFESGNGDFDNHVLFVPL